ncbi:MAG: hypothetical protein QXV97_07110 [Candidatus Caldarchaeum sp.]
MNGLPRGLRFDEAWAETAPAMAEAELKKSTRQQERQPNGREITDMDRGDEAEETAKSLKKEGRC